LPLVLRRHPDLADVGRLTLGQSLACVRLVLWDEAARRLISFRELKARFGADASDRAEARLPAVGLAKAPIVP
jgi:omega-6 fatty acid desaturase (delta-12 desaturase)